MKMLILTLVLVTSSIVAGQRPFFAGSKPIGFPDTPNRTTTTPDPLGNRFGDDKPIPIEANGDWDLIDRLSKLPIDKQPFWFINWKANESFRKDPQTYPQRPNVFLDHVPLNVNSGLAAPLNANSGPVNNGFPTPNPGFIGTEPTVVFSRFGTTTSSQTSGNVSPSGNFNNNANFNTTGSVFPNSNVYPNSNIYSNNNGNSNIYPNGNVNPNNNVYATGSPISNVNPTGNDNPNFNVYPNYNGYPTGNSNSYVYPNGNGNFNSTVYPNGNSNFNSNVYSTNNPNSNVYQTSIPNSHLNSGATKNSTFFHTTHTTTWSTTFKTSKLNVGPTNFSKYPEHYPRTDTYSQRSGREYN